jgi:hypothetical protein
MQKRFITVALAMLVCVSFVNGKTRKNLTAPPDTVKLQLMAPLSQSIQMNCVNLNRKFYVIDNLVLSKQDIVNKKTCFLLNNDFTISEVTAEGYRVQLKLYRNVRNTDFNPILDEQAYAKLIGRCRVYELVFPESAKLSDSFKLKLKYHILETDTTYVIAGGKDWIDFRGTEYWYPRNPLMNENISLVVKTTDENSFYINSKSIDYIQKRYLKEYKTSFIDMADSPAVLMFRKTGLK